MFRFVCERSPVSVVEPPGRTKGGLALSLRMNQAVRETFIAASLAFGVLVPHQLSSAVTAPTFRESRNRLCPLPPAAWLAAKRFRPGVNGVPRFVASLEVKIPPPEPPPAELPVMVLPVIVSAPLSLRIAPPPPAGPAARAVLPLKVELVML